MEQLKNASSIWMRNYQNIKVAFKDIAALVNISFLRIYRWKLAESGFKYTGIFPFDKYKNVYQ